MEHVGSVVYITETCMICHPSNQLRPTCHDYVTCLFFHSAHPLFGSTSKQQKTHGGTLRYIIGELCSLWWVTTCAGLRSDVNMDIFMPYFTYLEDGGKWFSASFLWLSSDARLWHEMSEKKPRWDGLQQ